MIFQIWLQCCWMIYYRLYCPFTMSKLDSSMFMKITCFLFSDMIFMFFLFFLETTSLLPLCTERTSPIFLFISLLFKLLPAWSYLPKLYRATILAEEVPSVWNGWPLCWCKCNISFYLWYYMCCTASGFVTAVHRGHWSFYWAAVVPCDYCDQYQRSRLQY